MKTFNTKLIAPFIITLIVTGCMPDSLTKFKKDAPKKPETSSTTNGSTEPSGPVVDNSGAIVPFTPPTFFFMGTKNKKYSFISGTSAAIAEITPNADGTLATGSASSASTFILSCALVTTLNTQSAALPAGLALLSTTACKISGTPTVS